MRIGILCGRETSFPEALVARLEACTTTRVQARMLELGGVSDDADWDVDLILDRISHDVPFYRMAMKHAVLAGVRVVNNPFWSSADDKFFGYALARKLGVAVPKTVLLPNKDHGEDVDAGSLRNLQYPLDWKAIGAMVGFPAFLKPADGGGWRGVSQVFSREEMLFRFDRSGRDTMVLQEAIEFDRYARCFCFGRSEVIVTRYDPGERRYLPLDDAFSAAELARMERDALTLVRALGYDIDTVEFAWRDGTPYAIDFTNPVPDMERGSVTEVYFQRLVEAAARFLVDAARSDGGPEGGPGGLLHGAPARGSGRGSGGGRGRGGRGGGGSKDASGRGRDGPGRARGGGGRRRNDGGSGRGRFKDGEQSG